MPKAYIIARDCLCILFAYTKLIYTFFPVGCIIFSETGKVDIPMFKVAENNSKIGKYLGKLIDERFDSRRQFCIAYLSACGETPASEKINNMSNRIAQIVKGNKAIQTHDLPYFTELLGVSCEQILSAGEYSIPLVNRVTNYSIACSDNPEEWEKYINREDKLILNCDEYCKTVLDYALEFGNYKFIKYLMDYKYIWFDSRNAKDSIMNFGAGTSIEHRNIFDFDNGLESKIKNEEKLRINLITLAVDNKDIEMLNRLRAREHSKIYYYATTFYPPLPAFDELYDERMIRNIADSDEYVLDYFTDTFEVTDPLIRRGGSNPTSTFMFPCISKLLDMLIVTNSPFTEIALKKALKFNNSNYKKICDFILSIKNDPTYSPDWMKNVWKDSCKRDFNFIDDWHIVAFRAICSKASSEKIYTNVACTTKVPVSPILRHLTEELNESYLAIKNIMEHLEEF